MTADNQHFIIEHIREAIGLQDFSFNIRKKNFFLKKPFLKSISTYLITLTDLRHLIIWDHSEEEDLDEDLKRELLICFQNTGAVSGLLVLQKSILQIMNPFNSTAHFSRIIEPVQPLFSGEIINEYSWIAESLDQYLDNLHRSVSRSFFQLYGEGEQGIRNRVILSGVLETILTKMPGECGISIPDPEKNLCIHHLISLGTEVPQYSWNDGNKPGFNFNEHKSMIEGGLTVPVPELLRIWLLDPILITRAIHRLVNRQKSLEKRKKDTQISICSISAVIASSVFQYVVQGLFKINEKSPAIIDPYSGTGELALHLLRMVTAGCNTPGSRFENIAGGCYCADASISSVLVTRFGVILHAIDGDFFQPDLYESLRNDNLKVIRDNIRVGTPIFSKEIQDEYCSEQEGKAAVQTLRPIRSGWPEILQDKPAVLITIPCKKSTWKNQEIRQYLCKHYASFSQDAMIPLYAAEQAISHQTFSSWIFLPASWLSDEHAGPFRKWIKKSRVTDLILEDRQYQEKGNALGSCLITKEMSPTMGIIRVSDEGSIISYEIERSHLPVEDGWSLEDPSEKQILESLMNDSVPFYDYCLGALYHPGEIQSEIQDGIWISIKAHGNQIRFNSGKERDPHADIIVKGPDPYLEGILSSSLIRWYWKYITRAQNSMQPKGAIAQIPIHQPDWFHEEEKESVQQIIASIHERTFLLQKMRYARTYHDKTRIKRQISLIEVKLNEEVCSLYRIPEPLYERLL